MIRIDGGGYDVAVGSGLIDRLGELVPAGRCFLVADSNLGRHGWTGRAAAALGARLIGRCEVPAGEASKSLRQLEALLDALLEAGIERGDQVVALGGGMVGDLAGLAAALVKRGCGFVPVPTTLLAQADAAIGGKTAVNARQGKNLIGAFHRPSAVVADVATLATLPRREMRCGYAEVVKYGLIGDPGFFAWCEREGEAALAGDEAALLHAIETSLRAKAAIVARDEREQSERALLNLGHSFGHAIEAETGLPHGEAVAIGLCLAFRFSASRGLCPAADADRVEAHLAAVGLPTRVEGPAPGRLVMRMKHDKKKRGAGLRLVLVRGIGRAFLADGIDPDEVESFLGALSPAPARRAGGRGGTSAP